MATTQTAALSNPALLARLDEARSRTDSFFDLLPPNALYERPVPERHRLIFYLGHLEAFDWNLLSGEFGLSSEEAELDKLFAFGIDPVGGGLPSDTPADWPAIAQVEQYRCRVRDRLDDALRRVRPLHSTVSPVERETLLHVAIEHRLMHAETLAYLLHNLPLDKKIPGAPSLADLTPSPQPVQVIVPAGLATLGQDHTPLAFGWDNEFNEQRIDVPVFSIGAFPVTNAEYLKFVQAGGYQQPRYWEPQDWEWRTNNHIEHPGFWLRGSDNPATASDPSAPWAYRAMFGDIPLPLSWPVYVSHAEASAFARWAGKTLPTETQWHRAAYGTPQGDEREYPWGDAAPDGRRGNFHYQSWDAMPVNMHPAGASAFGVFDLLGNGWEWTSTKFAPLPGFKPFSFYPGYSADFFDGKHFVMKGGSPRTDSCMLRRSFRNWFQPHYPYVYATFRCVEE
jgi:gamma-glutamyl hercynylcysteine S-oxide synthase